MVWSVRSLPRLDLDTQSMVHCCVLEAIFVPYPVSAIVAVLVKKGTDAIPLAFHRIVTVSV